MTTFTKEQLAIIAENADEEFVYEWIRGNVCDLAAFALSLWKRAENAEARCDSLSVDLDAERGACNDAEAERDEARRELAAWKEKSDRHETERDHFIADADRARRELRKATVDGMYAAAEIARNLRPKSACTCGNYLSFHNGVPGHQPGCLVGECIDIADEIEGRADEIDRSNRE